MITRKGLRPSLGKVGRWHTSWLPLTAYATERKFTIAEEGASARFAPPILKRLALASSLRHVAVGSFPTVGPTVSVVVFRYDVRGPGVGPVANYSEENPS